MKKKFTREVKVGLMVIVAIFLLYFGLNFLKGIDIFQKENQYSGKFEKLDGLEKSAPVKIKGYKVGQVSGIKYDFTKNESFTVYISIFNDVQLPVGTIMQLTDDGLMGGKIIELVYKPLSKNQSFYKSNAELPTGIDAGLMASIQTSLIPKIEKVTEQADSLMKSVRNITESPQLANSLNSIEKTTNELAITSTELKNTMKGRIPVVIDNLTTITNDFKQTSGNLKSIDLAGTMQKADYTIKNLQSLTEKLNSPDNSLGLLLNDKSLYLNLTNTAGSANNLLVDLKANPKRYVHFSLFGSKTK